MIKKLIIFFVISFSILTSGNFSVLMAEDPETLPPSLKILFEKRFEELTIPVETDIKKTKMKREYLHTNFEELWDAAIVILVQKVLIVHASKNSRTLIAVNPAKPPIPFTIYIEEKDNMFILYFYPMRNLYETKNAKAENVISIEADKEKELAEFLFDRIATELYIATKIGEIGG